jgi:putative peptidoglycan lipid II flippase
MYLPIGLFGVSIAAASTPALSRLAAQENKAMMQTTVASAIGLMLALNIPATLGLIALAVPITSLLFEHGRFTAADTAATARAVQFYAVGLVGYSIVRIVSPAFYALHRSRIPVVASIVTVAVNVVLNIALVRAMGFAGLALGTSLAAIVNAILQLVMLRRELGGIEMRRIAMTFLKATLAALLMAAAAWAADLWLQANLPGTAIVMRGARVAGAISVALAVLSAAAWVLRLHEFEEARTMIVQRVHRLRG